MHYLEKKYKEINILRYDIFKDTYEKKKDPRPCITATMPADTKITLSKGKLRRNGVEMLFQGNY